MIFSLPEMAAGLGSSLMRNEMEFMILDGASLVNILPLNPALTSLVHIIVLSLLTFEHFPPWRTPSYPAYRGAS